MVNAGPDVMKGKGVQPLDIGCTITAMIHLIVGFKIDVERVSAKTKISQNRELEDFSNVTSELVARGYVRMSSRMKHLQTRQNSDQDWVSGNQ
jgi:predicted FMN-binding regulatory protein PaiB